MVLIYRVESDDGTGMYIGQGGLTPMPMEFSEHHPAPDEDSKLVNQINYIVRKEQGDVEEAEMVSPWTFISKRGYFFGFDSQDQMRRWIYQDEWMKDLDDVGLHLTVYEVDPEDTVAGYTQAIFKRKNARQKYRTKLCDFFAIN